MPDWSHRLGDLRQLLADKLGAGARDLRRARPRLPRRLRREADVLLRAETMGQHPRFARLVDPREVARAERRISRHLRAYDPALDRRNRRKDAVARLAFCLLVTALLVVALLWWRGLV